MWSSIYQHVFSLSHCRDTKANYYPFTSRSWSVDHIERTLTENTGLCSCRQIAWSKAAQATYSEEDRDSSFDRQAHDQKVIAGVSIYMFPPFPHWPWGSTALYGDNARFHKNSRLKQSLKEVDYFFGFCNEWCLGLLRTNSAEVNSDQALQYNQINRHFENTDESFYKWMAGDWYRHKPI